MGEVEWKSLNLPWGQECISHPPPRQLQIYTDLTLIPFCVMYEAFLMVLLKSDYTITQKNETGPPPRQIFECMKRF